jgi:hypothetical protein
VRKLLSAACLVMVLAATACAPTTTTVAVAEAPVDPTRMSDADFTGRMMEMRNRFPPNAPGTRGDHAVAARELYERHLEHRRGLGLPDDPAMREMRVSDLENAPLNEARSAVARDFSARLAEMLDRSAAGSLGHPTQRAAAAVELLERHDEYRRRLHLPYLAAAEREMMFRRLIEAPGEATWEHRRAAMREQEARMRASREAAARLDERQVTTVELSRAAADVVSATQPNVPREQLRAAQLAVEAEIRSELENRRRSSANAAAQQREANLARLAMTGLADMPREITLAAQENLADARSPFDTRPNWRPEPAALRQEEVRLRNAIASRLEGERLQADQNARAAADAAARRQQADDAAARRQQADLQRAMEMARADAERERRERQNLRLIELGLGMAAGANRPPPPPSNDGMRTYNINGRIFNCTTSGTFTNCF